MRVLGYTFILFVDDMICQQKNTYTEFICNHIFRNIISHHNTVFWFQLECIQNIPVICWIRLAETGIFVGGDKVKICNLKTGPFYTAVGSNCREEGIGSQRYMVSHGFISQIASAALGSKPQSDATSWNSFL